MFRHKYLIRVKSLSVYLRGGYCFLEVDIFNTCYQFGCTDKFFNSFKY